MLISSTCERNEDCHSYVNFINHSEKNVIFALRFINIEGNCILNGEQVMKKESYDFRPYNSCIEDNLDSNTPLDIYIVDSDKYNEPGVFYDCDSIPIKNIILKQYSLTLEDLENSDFSLTYP